MTEENEWKPSRWTPPADLEEAFEDGRSTRKLPDGSTAVLSWVPEMEDRWWSYDGAIGFNTGLQIIDDPKHGPQLAPYSSRGGNGIMFVQGSQIEDELAKITEDDPLGQPWSYYPHDTSILRLPTSLHTMISWNDPFPAILVSHDGRIVLDEYYSASTLVGYVISEAVETDEQRKFYINHLFDLLYWYLRQSPRYSWKQPDVVSGWPSGELGSDEEIRKRAHSMWKLIDAKRVELVKKPRCARLRNLREWMLSMPSWASMIIGVRLADAGGLSLLAGSSVGRWPVNNAYDVYSPMNDAYCEANVANRCYSLSLLSSEQIHDDYDKCLSFEQLALEYGPCWLMQSLIALDRSPYDNPAALDLVKDSDHWKISIDRDRIREACRLAGAMNAPIELWPRFYSILEGRVSSRLDETTVLMLLATPIKNWAALDESESMASDHGKLIREVCYLVTMTMANAKWIDKMKMENVQRTIVGSLSPDRPIAGQTVDLAMVLDDAIGSIDDHGTQDPTIDVIMRLIKSKPDMEGTINGTSLIACDLSRMNVNES